MRPGTSSEVTWPGARFEAGLAGQRMATRGCAAHASVRRLESFLPGMLTKFDLAVCSK